MKLYSDIRPGRFLARPNRFIAQVEVQPKAPPVTAHVKNTGRCAELLVPGAQVFLAYSQNPGRKTPCDLVAVEKQCPGGPLLINMDSAAPNAAAGEWLAGGGLGPLEGLRAETTVGSSRFDFSASQNGRPVLVEVKGCTLEREGLALFPDAPTLRGLRHLRELICYAQKGWRCCLLVVIQFLGAQAFCANRETQPAFADAFLQAREAGVELIAMDCMVTPDSLALRALVPVLFD